MNLINDIGAYLQTKNVGTMGTNLFLSCMPDTAPDTCVTLLETGGPPPDGYLPTAEEYIQVVVRASSYPTGTALVDSIVKELHQLANVTLVTNGYYFRYILLLGEPGHLGRDDLGHDTFSINFRAKVNRK